MITLFSIIAILMVLGVPVVLFGLLLYFGSKSGREEQEKRQRRQRGFDVIMTGDEPAKEKERDNDHG